MEIGLTLISLALYICGALIVEHRPLVALFLTYASGITLGATL